METITVIGGNLYELAAIKLGNALQWINLARVNNLTDPMISGQIDLIIPPFAGTLNDGIGPQ